MQPKWFYAEAGESVGPLSTAEVYQRIFATIRREAHFVWAAGMPDWADARKLPEFAPAFEERAYLHPAARPEPAHLEPAHLEPSHPEPVHPEPIHLEPARPVAADGETKKAATKKAPLAQRARHELIAFLGLSTYLWICLGTLIFYKAAILRSVGVAFAPLGVAIVKALILAKFIMLLEALKLGEGGPRSVPIFDVLKKSGLFAVFLFILTIVEELLVGYFHGKEVRDILEEFAGGTLPQAFAVGLLLFLVMIPYFAYREFKPDLFKPRTYADAERAAEKAQ
jgi:hypothetical protein